MYLMSPTDVAAAIQANCNGRAPTQDDTTMLAMLALLTPRVEAAMNVETLSSGAFADCFLLPVFTPDPSKAVELRLTNAYVKKGTIVVKDPNGQVVPETDYTTNLKLGTIRLSAWVAGIYSVEYTSGFAPATIVPPDPLPDGYVAPLPVAEGVPEWMKALVVSYATLWFRTTVLAPKVSKDISAFALDMALRREIASRVYGSYMRPRQPCLWPISSVVVE